MAPAVTQLVEAPRIVLVEPDDSKREVLAGRLRMQGYTVEAVAGAVAAATQALASPPSAVVADLWMPSVSGVQMCRLLRSEPATQDVPIILRGEGDAPRDRFWAERAGAAAYVPKGRMGELVRSLSRTHKKVEDDGFFFQVPETIDIRDRISELLDSALFESVLAAECRALASSESFARLFDLFSQFLTQVTTYRWMAITLSESKQFALHVNPSMRDASQKEAELALQATESRPNVWVEDEDASNQASGPEPIVRQIHFGTREVARLAMAPTETGARDQQLMDLVAKEIGGPIRMSCLMEDAHRLASYDPLTSTMNRRALTANMQQALTDSRTGTPRLSALLLDVDHFKVINDTRGHAIGDRVLSALGELLLTHAGNDDVGRWGGEEFVVLLHDCDELEGLQRAEELRGLIEAMVVTSDKNETVSATASIGLASLKTGETIEGLLERADQAMYAAKVSGRNRVVSAERLSIAPANDDDTRRMTGSRISIEPHRIINNG